MRPRTPRSPHISRRRHGFTLLEILLVLAILVVLGGLVTVSIGNAQKKAYVDLTTQEISSLKSMLNMYKLDTGRYPSTQTGLQGLVTQPSDLPNPQKWKGPYTDEDISAVSQDAWDNPYIYESSSPTTFTIRSMGPDLVDGTADDISS